MNSIKKLLAALLVAVMALSLAGCGDTTWIAEVDGEAVPSGLYIYYQKEGYGDAVSTLYQENSDTMDYLYLYAYYQSYNYVEPSIFDTALSSGETVKEHINSYAMDMCKQAVVIDKLFDQLGLEISPEDQDRLDTQLRTAWSNSSESWEKIGVSESSLKLALLADYKFDKVFDAYYEIGGLNGTTEEEIEAYFADNYARVKYMTFQFADSLDDAVDETRKNEQKELADSYLERLNNGESMDDIIAEHDALVAAENAEDSEDADAADEAEPETEETADGETAEVEDTEEDEYANESVFSKDATYPTEKFISYVFNNCNVGEYSIIQDDLCFYLVQRLDILEREGLYEDNRDSILSELFDSDYTTLINNTLKECSVTENANAVKRYKAEKAFPDSFE